MSSELRGDDLLVGVFAPDGLQFVVRWRQQHGVKFSDDGCQLRRLIAGVELQDRGLKNEAGRFRR